MIDNEESPLDKLDQSNKSGGGIESEDATGRDNSLPDRGISVSGGAGAGIDQVASESDQTAADGDQTASDRDQTSSERDEAQAEVDQLVSDRDQASADRDRDVRGSLSEPDGAYELSRAERRAGTLLRDATSEERTRTAADRLEHAAQRDESAKTRDSNADARDRTAAERDLAAEELERQLDRPHAAVDAARDHAATVRARSASDRARAAADREQAAADRVTAAEERAAARDQLRDAQEHTTQVVGQLAGGIAHNFNNLLAIILLYAHQMIPRANEPLDRGDIEEIISAADRGAELAKQLLGFAGLGKTSEQPVQPSVAIRKLEPSLRLLVSADILLNLQLDPGELAVMVDAAELEHIIMNLTLNARDAMPGGGTVTITSTSRTLDQEEAAEHDTQPGQYVQVSVSDTGVGIPEEVLGRIFEPFFTTKGQNRTGLGLATVQGVVNQAGGWIDIQTIQGTGTTFAISLPEAATLV